MSPLMAAADMAVEHLNKDPSFFSLQSRGYRFKVVTGRSDCSNVDGLYQLVKLATLNNNTRESLDAVIGPQCDADCENVARLSSDWKLPMISFSCMSDNLSDKQKYAFFSRTITKLDGIYRFVRAVVTHFGWDHVTCIAPRTNVAKLLKAKLEEDNFTAAAFSGSFHEHGNLAIHFLRKLASNSRVFVLFGNNEDIGDTLLLADELGMLNGDFVFMTVLMSRELLLAGQSDRARRSALDIAMEGLLDITFEDDYNHTEYLLFYQNLSNALMSGAQSNMYFTPRLIFDSFYAYGLAVQEAIEDGFELEDRQEIFNRIYPRVFLGE
ncbi:atrial natriuretic peptide receptor 3-like [Liolophura sinensis]|uniref:atrial natriuretic peptide receptor 3-like n=1 Tax=Liolophura sinensis TaxID=3198878 RepID=UPI003158EAF3